MKLYKQLIVGDKGDCWRTCIANMLCMHPKRVPHFIMKGKFWIRYFNKWLFKKGYIAWTCGVKTINHEDSSMWIASGVGGRGHRHAVIMRGNKLFHDPHPQGNGLKEIDTCTVLFNIKYIQDDCGIIFAKVKKWDKEIKSLEM